MFNSSLFVAFVLIFKHCNSSIIILYAKKANLSTLNSKESGIPLETDTVYVNLRHKLVFQAIGFAHGRIMRSLSRTIKLLSFPGNNRDHELGAPLRRFRLIVDAIAGAFNRLMKLNTHRSYELENGGIESIKHVPHCPGLYRITTRR